MPTPENWTPASISTAVWVDATDPSTLFDASTGGSLVVGAGNVKRIEDKSGNNIHLSQVGISAPSRVLATINGYDTIKAYDGQHVLAKMDTNVLRNSSRGLIFSVIRASTSNFTNRMPFSVQVDSSADTRLVQNRNLNVYRASGRRLDTDSSEQITSNTTHDNNWTIVVVSADWANRILTLRENGLETATSTTFQTAGSTSDSTSIVSLLGITASTGTVGANSNFTFRGDFAEGVIIENDLSSIELLEGYAAHKYGLTGSLPIGHPYKTTSPTVATLSNSSAVKILIGLS